MMIQMAYHLTVTVFQYLLGTVSMTNQHERRVPFRFQYLLGTVSILARQEFNQKDYVSIPLRYGFNSNTVKNYRICSKMFQYLLGTVSMLHSWK